MGTNMITARPDLSVINSVLESRVENQRTYKNAVSDTLQDYYENNSDFCDYGDNKFVLQIVGGFSEIERLLNRMSQPVTLRMTDTEGEPREYTCNEPVFSLVNTVLPDEAIDRNTQVWGTDWAWISGHEESWGGGISDLYVTSANITWLPDNSALLDIRGYSLWRIPCEAIQALRMAFPSLSFNAWSMNTSDDEADLISYTASSGMFSADKCFSPPKLHAHFKRLYELVPSEILRYLGYPHECYCDLGEYSMGMFVDCNFDNIKSLICSTNYNEEAVVFSRVELRLLSAWYANIGAVNETEFVTY